MKKRVFPRPVYRKAKAELKRFLDRNYDPNEKVCVVPSIMGFRAPGIPNRDQETFLGMMVEEGVLMRHRLGGYADARYANFLLLGEVFDGLFG